MPAPQDTTPAEVRRVVQVQLGLAAVFLVAVFALLDGLDADRPAIWLMGLPALLIVIGAVLAERAWLGLQGLDPGAPNAERAALEAFVSITTRKFVYCEGALLLCVILAFASNSAGWLILIAGVPGLAVLAFETWPSPRNTSLAAVSLDQRGATSHLVEQFDQV